jgi:hypothetical protein
VEYIQIRGIDDPLFAEMHRMMQSIFPPEEVLAFELWREPLQDPGIHVFVAVHENQVVGATEYRYYPDLRVAMTDFTIIGKPGLGIGPFLASRRSRHLRELADDSGTLSLGMFAEIYDPNRVAEKLDFGFVSAMDPFVRREVLAHLGYKRVDFPYIHPSWELDGNAVTGLDLCFQPADPERESVPAELVVRFLQTYYSALSDKPDAWHDMISELKDQGQLKLMPI